VADSRFDGFMKAAGPLPIVGLVVALSTALILAAESGAETPRSVVATFGDLKPVHAGVTVQGARVGGLRRLALGDRVVTDADGRARLRLDDGTTAVVDRSTRVRLDGKGLALESGRLHVTSPLGAHPELVLGALTVLLSGATAGLDHRGDKVSVYAADGELTVRALGQEKRVRAGETARIAGGKLEIVPERAYDDWTFGLARTWAARGTPRRALGELWGDATEDASATAPLTIRSHRVNASVDRELARTTGETTFFNGGSSTIQGDFRVALPPGALVSSFAVTRGGAREVGRIALASRTQAAATQEDGVLEWAGDGWLRGTLSRVEPGQEITVSVSYSEWLSPRQSDDRAFVQYRYPLVGGDQAPLIGEFSARVDASPSGALGLEAGLGARSDGRAAVVARSDFRPSADFVVDVEMRRLSERARLYVAPSEGEGAGSAVLLRTELPPAEPADGVTLAIVLDSSGSIDPALLEAERALTRALLEGLGSRDRVVVLGADQSTRPLGPAELGPLDAARKKAIARALDGLSPGGASDLGRALEAAADTLPADAPAAMVVYVGDGWPTLGDGRAETILARLARRPNGAPRLGAVALGPLSNRRVLAALTEGTGPLFEVADSADAAGVAIELISDALRPALAGVEIDLGPEVDQVYPRGPRAIAAGETLTAVGRVRGAPPSSVKIRYRDARGPHEEVRRVELFRTVDPAEIQRRWAAERVEEIVLRGKGREAATDVALRAGLITPWTALKLGASQEYVPSHLEARMLDLSSDGTSALGPVLVTPPGLAGSITDVDEQSGSGRDLAQALRGAVGRILDAAAPSVRACRDSRVALRPELTGALDIALEVDGDGFPHDVRVRGATPAADDDALNRCVALVIEALRFPATGVPARVRVEHLIRLPPPPPSLGARRCSNVSTLAMPLRRGAWWSRLARREREPTQVYLEAKRQCELTTWTDRRALLELMLRVRPNGPDRVELAEQLDLAGESDAAALIRREAVRRVQSPEELAAVRGLLLGTERYPATVFEQRYRAAAGDAQRLEVVARFLELAPHDSRLRRRQVALLDALGNKPEIAELARVLRSDPFADAELLCDAASALRRAGFDAEARRTFGELAERAPRDPWTRALLGDRLRAEGWFDEATAAYAVLEELVPEDGRAALRAALAHAGAGRVDIAERLLSRVAQTGGRAGDSGLGELARQLGRSIAGEALSQKPALDPAEAGALRRVARELAEPDTSHVLLLRAEGARADLKIELQTGAGPTKETRAPDVAASSLGLYLFRVGGDTPLGAHRLSASRPATLAPAAPITLRVDTLPAMAAVDAPFQSERRVLPHDGKAVEFLGRPR
jgi:Mg-chelatase subunit ChlD